MKQKVMMKGKHRWTSSSRGHTYRCIDCGAYDFIGADHMDSSKIVNEFVRIKSRRDCPGQRR
jgi:hypothetical protein